MQTAIDTDITTGNMTRTLNFLFFIAQFKKNVAIRSLNFY